MECVSQICMGKPKLENLFAIRRMSAMDEVRTIMRKYNREIQMRRLNRHAPSSLPHRAVE